MCFRFQSPHFLPGGLPAIRRWRVRCGYAGLWLALLCSGVDANAGEIVRIANTRLQIGVDASTGRLAELIDLESGHNFTAGAAQAADLWAVEYVAQGAARTLEPAAAAQFECRRLAGVRPELRLSWSGFSAADLRSLRVEIVARLDGEEPSGRWELAVTKLPGLALQQVHFPRLPGIAKQPDEFLAVPVWTGELLANPRDALTTSSGKGRRLEWDYPGKLSLQCMAFYRQKGPGLYLACDDAGAMRKSFAVQGGGSEGLALEIAHLPENGARNLERYALGYGVVIGVFHGNWVTAAERYRAWGTQQRWASESRLRQSAVPEWARQTALWVWNRGKSEGVLRPAAVLQRELGLPVSVLWHWWHGCAYDAGFPEYLPPREGAESFRLAMAEAHASGLHAMVYMNQRLWGLTTRSWQDEDAGRFAVKLPDGTFRREVYNTFTNQACASMCLGTAYWRDKYAGIAGRAVTELSVDGIYMDQACTSLSCYDAGHGHPLGGGSYWMDGFRRLATDIRQRAREVRPLALAGEGSGEAWLPYLDLMLSLQVSRERYAAPGEGWEAIPFFPAVYHPYAVQFGNYSSLTMPPYDELWPAELAPAEPLQLLDRKYSRQFRYEQARAFVWGQQPMLANFRPSQLQDRAEEIAYVLRLARLRQRALPYLLSGEFLAPPELNAPGLETDMSRLSIYAGQKGGLTTYVKRLPLALAGAWRAPDGKVAVALASIASEALELTLAFDPAGYGLTRTTQAFRIDESGRKPLPFSGRSGTLRISLPPQGACLVEFVAP